MDIVRDHLMGVDAGPSVAFEATGERPSGDRYVKSGMENAQQGTESNARLRMGRHVG